MSGAVSLRLPPLTLETPGYLVLLEPKTSPKFAGILDPNADDGEKNGRNDAANLPNDRLSKKLQVLLTQTLDQAEQTEYPVPNR